MNQLAVKGMRIVAPLRYRDFRLLWIGQVISALGNPFQAVAVAWLVLQQLKGSPLELATTMLALTIPQALMSLVGGIFIDRHDARSVMLWSDVTRTITTGLIALLAFTGLLSFWLLCLTLLFHSAANGLFSPAARSIPPHLVPKEALDGTNSLMELVSHLGMLLGAVPAGILIAYQGAAFAFAINSGSFAIAVLATLLMTPLHCEVQSTKPSIFHSARQGLTYLAQFPWLIALLAIDTCAAIAAIGPISVGLPLLAKNVLHVGAEGYGLLVWSFGLGSVLGMLLQSFVSPHHDRGRFFCLIQLLEAPLLAGVAFTPLPIAMFCLAGMGALNGILAVLLLSLIQANVAKDMMGRMMSFVMLSSLAFVPFSLFLSGVIANAASTQILFAAAGVLMMLSAMVGLLIPALRHLD